MGNNWYWLKVVFFGILYIDYIFNNILVEYFIGDCVYNISLLCFFNRLFFVRCYYILIDIKIGFIFIF